MGHSGARPIGANYRSEIPGLYMGGSPTHSGGVIHFAAGYNAAGVVANDLKLANGRSEPRVSQNVAPLHNVCLQRTGKDLDS